MLPEAMKLGIAPPLGANVQHTYWGEDITTNEEDIRRLYGVGGTIKSRNGRLDLEAQAEQIMGEARHGVTARQYMKMKKWQTN